MPKEIIELRVYRLKENSGDLFHHLFTALSLPLLKKWNIKVLFFGQSMVDKDSYTLIRQYNSLNERLESQKQFYESDDWKNGPREQIISLIEESIDIVLPHFEFKSKL